MSHHIRSGRHALAALVAAALIVLVPATGMAAAAVLDAPMPQATPPERVIVVWETGISSVERVAARADADAALVRTLGDPRFQLVRPADGQSTGELLASLRDDSAVRLAVRDGYRTAHATTNDPFFGQLWGLLNTGLGVDGFSGAVAGADIDAQAAWDRTRGTPSTIVAIIDSGHRLDHPDLAPVTWVNPGEVPGNNVDDDGNGIRDDVRGADFVGSNLDSPRVDGDPTDDNAVDGGHGIHVAGTAAAAGNNGVGITGVAQDVRVMPLRICGYSYTLGRGGFCSDSAQISAINYAGRHGARVANLSLGGPTYSAALEAAYAANPNVLFVVSAGNGGSDGIGDDNDVVPQYPCALPQPNVVCVAATNQADQRARFSNYGDVTVDLGAPGTETYSAYPRYTESTTLFSENFQGGDFATRWMTSGAGFGTSTEPPLTSVGITDTPGGFPGSGQVYQVELRDGVTVPAGVNACRLRGSRFISNGFEGRATYSIIVIGGTSFQFTPADTVGSAMVPFQSGLVPVSSGQQVRLRFRYEGPSVAVSGDGVWYDDLVITCNSALSAAPTYGFLQGTSMASPHVAGAAALLYSLKPSATVAEVRRALLSSVDPVAALAGTTVTGGRLNVARALDVLVPPGGDPPGGDPPGGDPPGGDPPGGGTTIVTPPNQRPQIIDPPPRSPRPQCKVPRLAGLTLARARAALRRAHCRLGRVTRPRARRGRRLPPLVVRSSRPGVNATLAENAAVAVTLKAAPRRARRRARRARRRARRRR